MFSDEKSLRTAKPLIQTCSPPEHVTYQNLSVPSNRDIVKMLRSETCDEYLMPNYDESDFPKYNIIDQIDDSFFSAIHDIEKESEICVGSEGVTLSRDGILCWLVIMTKEVVYLFDIVKLGTEAFNKGLKSVLESKWIEKVLHDSSMLADYLYHVEKIELRKVFDTQAAYTILFKRLHSGQLPVNMEPLLSCAVRLLAINPNQFPLIFYRLDYLKEDQEIWRSIRPLPKPLIFVLLASVMHLSKLRRCIIHETLQELYDASEIKVKIASESSLQNMRLLRAYPRQVPAAFRQLDLPSREFTDKLGKTGTFLRRGENQDFDQFTDSGWIPDQRWPLNYVRFSRESWTAMECKKKAGLNEAPEFEPVSKTDTADIPEGNRELQDNTEVDLSMVNGEMCIPSSDTWFEDDDFVQDQDSINVLDYSV